MGKDEHRSSDDPDHLLAVSSATVRIPVLALLDTCPRDFGEIPSNVASHRFFPGSLVIDNESKAQTLNQNSTQRSNGPMSSIRPWGKPVQQDHGY